MFLEWSYNPRVVKTVQIGCFNISRSQGQKQVSKMHFLKIIFSTSSRPRAFTFSIASSASSRGPLLKLLTLCPYCQKMALPSRSQFYIKLLLYETLQTTSHSKPLGPIPVSCIRMTWDQKKKFKIEFSKILQSKLQCPVLSYLVYNFIKRSMGSKSLHPGAHKLYTLNYIDNKWTSLL